MKHIKIYEDFVNESAVNEGRFEMYTPAGDKACQKLVDGIVAKINGDKRVTGEEIEKLLKDGVAKVAKTHREVHDTEPRGEIAHQISKALKAAGYSFYFDSYGHLNEGFSKAEINEGKKKIDLTEDNELDTSAKKLIVYFDEDGWDSYSRFQKDIKYLASNQNDPMATDIDDALEAEGFRIDTSKKHKYDADKGWVEFYLEKI
jgi:hypothetical protein